MALDVLDHAEPQLHVSPNVMRVYQFSGIQSDIRHLWEIEPVDPVSTLFDADHNRHDLPVLPVGDIHPNIRVFCIGKPVNLQVADG